MQRAHQYVIFLKIRTLDRLFEIAHVDMNDFGGCTRSGSREVAGFEQDRSNSAKLHVEGAGRSGRAPSDYAEIKPLPGDVFEFLSSVSHGCPDSECDLRTDPENRGIR